MNDLNTQESKKLIKRINTTLPDSLAAFVSAKTGPDGLYETPSEYIRDLIRHDMDESEKQDLQSFYQTALKSLESPTSPLEDNFFEKKRKKLQEMQKAKNNS